MSTGAGTSVFRLLYVCTGNICRSPMAELLTRAGLAARLPAADGGRVQLASAGTGAVVGHPVDPLAAELLAGLGIDAGDFQARQLSADAVAGADLVLTATRAHRAAAVTLVPRVSARCFTMREASRLLARVDPGDLPADLVARGTVLTAAAHGARGLVAVDDPADDDLTDPYGGTAEDFRRCAQQLDAALRLPVGLLVGDARRSTPATVGG